MDRTTFADHFRRAAISAREFGQTFVIERLPEDLRFDVHFKFNPDVVDDGTFEAEDGLSFDRALERVYRSDGIPMWIDISVSAEDGQCTILDVRASRELVGDDGRLWYYNEGYPPFHVQGPFLPPNYKEGVPFSLRRRG